MTAAVRWMVRVAAAGLLAGAAAVPAYAQSAGPEDPAYATDTRALAGALHCPEPLDGDTEPVLLVHATFTYGAEQFSWNYGRRLPERARQHCLVSYPDRGFGDQQVAAEYVAYAVQELGSRTGRPVDVVGHSQGGLVARWAITFWPSVRRTVDDLISLAVPHHGLGSVGAGSAALSGLPASFWQFGSDSAFLSALNRGDETPGAVDYTQVYSASDGLTSRGEGRTAALDAGAAGPRVANVLLQEICPGRVVDHVAMGTTDRLAFEVVVDALTHPGPATAARLPAPRVCRRPHSIAPGGPSDALPRLVLAALRRGLPDLHLRRSEPRLAAYAGSGS